MTDHLYALIMAGGGGTRLWPLSRKTRPKQMLPLIERELTMFQMTVRRMLPLVPHERIFIVTGADQVEALQASTPGIPAENYVVEPFGRNSGPAAGLGALAIHERDPQAVIATLTSDHYIAEDEAFRQVIRTAAAIAQGGKIVTLGITPTFPAKNFGYIQRGELLAEVNGLSYYEAANFTEKPKLEKAIEFLQTGLYSWNSGMFIWTAERALKEFKGQQPVMYDLLTRLRPYLGVPDFVAQATPLWEQMPAQSLDYAIMEHAANIAVIPVEIGWSDIGSWDAVFDLHQRDTHENVIMGDGDHHIQIDTNRTLIVSDKMVVTIGIEDLVVVDTEDALLICPRDQAQEVRQIVEALRNKGLDRYL